MIFKIIGMIVVGFFVFIFVLAIAGKFWLKRKLGEFVKDANELGKSNMPFEVAPKINISLIKLSNYLPSEKALKYRRELEQSGFERINWYEVPEMNNVQVMGAYRDDGMFAVIYDSPMSVHYDLLAVNKDNYLMVIKNAQLNMRPVIGSKVMRKQVASSVSIRDALVFFEETLSSAQVILKKSDFENIFLRSYDA